MNINKDNHPHLLNLYTYKNQERLRYGYTTGSCAAAASKAATIMLLQNVTISTIELMTPKGILLTLPVLDIEKGDGFVSCAIRKDGGDDPDVTNGILIYSTVSILKEPGVIIDGGIGVGRVTKKGLDIPIGNAAINKVPRSMIEKEVSTICSNNQISQGVKVVISVPEGEEIAKKTFNERLGIIGGISILGTSGIVEPMSETALIDTIKVEMKFLSAKGEKYLVVTPGNYGEDFARDTLHISLNNAVKCSNFVGEAIDLAVELRLDGLLFIGHIGKFIKLAGGIMNTHSKSADARMEILTANALVAGANTKTLRNIMNSTTTDAAIEHLVNDSVLSETMNEVEKKIDFYLNNRARGNLKIGAISFSNQYGLLLKTSKADELLEKLQTNNIV
jgi:cobalt-precorrin-5B (C1)-methyltransferase